MCSELVINILCEKIQYRLFKKNLSFLQKSYGEITGRAPNRLHAHVNNEQQRSKICIGVSYPRSRNSILGVTNVLAKAWYICENTSSTFGLIYVENVILRAKDYRDELVQNLIF